MPHVSVRLHMEDPIAAAKRPLEQRLIQDVPLMNRDARTVGDLRNELAATGREVVHENDFDSF
jgi:hypothetical protein